jgi:hypothetical protein
LPIAARLAHQLDAGAEVEDAEQPDANAGLDQNTSPAAIASLRHWPPIQRTS